MREINRKNSKIERVIREREKEFFLLTTYDSFSVLFMGRETEREREKESAPPRTYRTYNTFSFFKWLQTYLQSCTNT